MAYRFKARSAVPGAKALIQAAIAVVADYPAVAKVLNDTTFANASLVGEFNEADRNIDPGAGNVEKDIAYMIHGDSKKGTFVVPDPKDVKLAIEYGDAKEFVGEYAPDGTVIVVED